MQRVLASPARRRWLLAAAGLIGAAAVFGSGILVAGAVDDEGGGATTYVPVPAGQAVSRPGFGAPNNPALAREDDGAAGESPAVRPAADAPASGQGGGLDRSIYPGYCGGVLDDSIIAESTIDLASAGFEPRFLNDGFRLRSLTVRATGPCSDDGTPNNEVGDPVVDSQWLHSESGYEVSISQILGGEAVANVIDGASASFSAGGYTYFVYVYGGVVVYPVEDGPATSPSGDLAAPGVDPKAVEVLNLVIASLVPDLGDECFYHSVAGDWGDLAALGIGDPRGAIPSGFTQQYLNVRTFTPPANDCGNDAPAPTLGGFDASFVQGSADSPEGGIYLSAYRMGPGETRYPGYADAYSASWSNGAFYFNVSGKTDAGGEAIRAIARALDPSFDNACIAVNGPIDGSGLPAPVATEGFTITSSQVTGTSFQGDCSRIDTSGYGQVTGSWTLEGEDTTVINAGFSRYPGETSPRGGYISDFDVSWSDGAGTWFYVNAYTRGISPEVDRELLIQVAASLDPGFDVDSLDEGGGIEKPVPAEGAPSR
jgi:hypothetical protein